MRTNPMARVWTFLLLEGGRWSCPELSKKLLDVKHIPQVVRVMVLSGYVVRYGRDDGHVHIRYAVTPSCRTPSGVRLSDLMAAKVVTE